MQQILDFKLESSQAALWFVGQSGFICKSCDTIVAIDPYLSDSIAKLSPKLKRIIPVPIEPADLKTDIFIVTHDHLDHLDPETIAGYRYKDTTKFVAPSLACRKLQQLGIKSNNIRTVDVGQSEQIGSVHIKGIYTIPNEPAVVDTAGYLVRFQNGRSFYHTSDTDLSPLLLAVAPHAEAGLFCINGKWGNMSVEKAVELAVKVRPRFAIPHHYDIMELNYENPETFRYLMSYAEPQIRVEILQIMKPFVWGSLPLLQKNKRNERQ
ncbi:MAG: MBL fold metallo-hydrolase [Sedimentisphaerales bacterium]